MMTTYSKYLFFLLIISAAWSCTPNEWEDIQHIREGYAAFSDSSRYEVILTKDPVADSVIYEIVDVHLEFVFYSKITDLEKIGILKTLYNESGNIIAASEILTKDEFTDTLSMDIIGADSLLAGLDFHPDSINSGYYFVFSTFLVTVTGDRLVSSFGNFSVDPEYIDFCTLPDLPLGTYEAYNKETGFKKDVEILYLEVMEGVWFLVITDFGLDWSTWDDHWYGTNFYLDCPLPNKPHFSIKLAGWGIDQPLIQLEMDNDDGVPETRPLRIMPWIYAPDSPDFAYYDATNKQLIFKDIYVLDSWWGIDNYFIKEITFTYKGE